MKLSVSFSGGETSGLMAILCKIHSRYKAYEKLFLFCNTSMENEETLVFADKVDRHFGLNLVWLEAVQHHGQRKGAGFRMVNFQTAARDGSVFEDAIRKYGIPNRAYPHCTAKLKTNVMNAYLRSIGWVAGSYYTAIGIRSDEIDRVRYDRDKLKLLYPLAFDIPIGKPGVNTFWLGQPFRLELKGYQGNCKFCWKKSLRKHLTLIEETPEVYDFPRRMEATYPCTGPEFDIARTKAGIAAGFDRRRVFFRQGMSTDDLFAEYERQRGQFEPASNDADEYDLFDPTMDLADGCEESCEVYGQ